VVVPVGDRRVMCRRLTGVWDRRRWRTAWAALFDDAFLFIGPQSGAAGRPARMTIYAIAPDDGARLEMISLAEGLPDALRAGWFDDLEREGGRFVEDVPEESVGEPEPGRMNDPRRRAAAMDVLRSDTFLAVTATELGGARAFVTAIPLVESERDRARVLDAVERVSKVLVDVDLDRLGERYEWDVEERTGEGRLE
jgi:hypothetical protein